MKVQFRHKGRRRKDAAVFDAGRLVKVVIPQRMAEAIQAGQGEEVARQFAKQLAKPRTQAEAAQYLSLYNPDMSPEETAEWVAGMPKPLQHRFADVAHREGLMESDGNGGYGFRVSSEFICKFIGEEERRQFE